MRALRFLLWMCKVHSPEMRSPKPCTADWFRFFENPCDE